MPTERYVFLDLVRSFAITLVLSAHIGQQMNSPIGQFAGIQGFYFVSLGGVGVTLFLILSGIVLELTYGPTKISYRAFMLNRILKIYPVYYIALGLGISIFVIRTYHVSGSIGSPWMIGIIPNLAACITGFYAFLGQFSGPFVGTSWFIGVIMSMYFIFLPLSSIVRRYPHHTLIITFFIEVGSRIVIGQCELVPNRPLDWFPLCRIFEFVLGIYLAHAVNADIWSCLNHCTRTGTITKFVGELSFPLFLVHYPLLFAVSYLPRLNVNQYLAIIIYISVSTWISWVVFISVKNTTRRVKSAIDWKGSDSWIESIKEGAHTFWFPSKEEDVLDQQSHYSGAGIFHT